MIAKNFQSMLALCLLAGAGTALACDYTAGETRFVDYATCRYGEDSILVVSLPEGQHWEQCIYQAEPFQPEKLLAVTKERNGKEILSINDRSEIGNPCYLAKRACDLALRAQQDGS